MSRISAGDPAVDVELSFVSGRRIQSEIAPDVWYQVERVIGKGGFGFACLALRHGPDGSSPVVLKITRPRIVVDAGDVALRAVKKEAVALGRLNERVPPTPFVVRLLDTGSLTASEDGRSIDVPWIAIEYVHGGVEGETLQRRVRHALEHTGCAFDPERARRVLDHLTRGLSEIHAAEVVHRDLKPSNVLACGFGHEEIFKISDFGIARPTGLASTFGDLTLGTPGYVAPEQVHLREEIGPWTDVFSLACVIYFVLTGQKYFQVPSSVEGVMAATSSKRASVLDATGLCPELRQQPSLCVAIDDVLRTATLPDPKQRIPSARQFAQSLSSWLENSGSGSASDRLIHSIASTRPMLPRPSPAPGAWTVRQAPRDDLVIGSLAWDSGAHCLAATANGLLFWDGTRWTEAPTHGLPGVRFVRRWTPGTWIVCATDDELYAYTREGLRPVGARKHRPNGIVSVDGDLDDLAVFVTHSATGPALAALSGGRWLKPLPLAGVAHLAALSRVDDDRWLVVGRRAPGGPFAALYAPLAWELVPLELPPAGALVACASVFERQLAVAAGGRGLLLRVDGEKSHALVEPSAPDWSAVGVDVHDGTWAAGRDGIWFGTGAAPHMTRVWHDPRWQSPFVGLLADVGFVLAVSVDGGVLEYRDAQGRNPSIPPSR